MPGVPVYAAANFCVKSSTYCILFWLPLYLADMNVDNKFIPYISTTFDLGTITGGIITGLLSDRLGARAIVMVPMLLFSAICMFIVNFSLNSQAGPYFVLIYLIGIFLGGPYNIIISAIAVDLSQ